MWGGNEKMWAGEKNKGKEGKGQMCRKQRNENRGCKEINIEMDDQRC